MLLGTGTDKVFGTDKVSGTDKVPGTDTELNTDSVLVREPGSAAQANLVG